MPVMGATVQAFTLVSRLLMTISLWHAPVPWGHAHLGDSAGLTEHLASHHAQNSGLASLGFHWHLEVPDWGHPCPMDSGPEGSCLVTILAFDSAVVSAEHWSDTPDQCLTVCMFAAVPTSQTSVVVGPYRSRGYLGTYAPTHSSQQLLCRMSC